VVVIILVLRIRRFRDRLVPIAKLKRLLAKLEPTLVEPVVTAVPAAEASGTSNFVYQQTERRPATAVGGPWEARPCESTDFRGTGSGRVETAAWAGRAGGDATLFASLLAAVPVAGQIGVRLGVVLRLRRKAGARVPLMLLTRLSQSLSF
jgi:hypothetical protein